MKRNYFILPPTYGYIAMCESENWERVDAVKDAEIIIFTGGADVHPDLYNHGLHAKTNFDKERDAKEQKFFEIALANNIAMVGICRGAQFLNVMSGGEMFQHVDGHGSNGTHTAFDTHSGDEFQVTSTHHQTMKPSRLGLVLATARESTFREECVSEGKTNRQISNIYQDTEVVYYTETNCLCFQPHPEFLGHDDMTSRFFDYVEEYNFK